MLGDYRLQLLAREKAGIRLPVLIRPLGGVTALVRFDRRGRGSSVCFVQAKSFAANGGETARRALPRMIVDVIKTSAGPCVIMWVIAWR
jgi:hypothetical protein